MTPTDDGSGGHPDDDRDESVAPAPADLRFVGPATAGVLEDAGIDPGAIPAKRVSHAELLAAGVNPGVAARIRRWYSLAWSFEGGADLDRRAEQVRGLGDDERDWVAASAGDWQTDHRERSAGEQSAAASTDGSGEAAGSVDGPGEAAAAESIWRERSRPVPVTELDGVGEKRAAHLARAGINSVRSMTLADPEEVAESLDLSPTRVARWREQARELL